MAGKLDPNYRECQECEGEDCPACDWQGSFCARCGLGACGSHATCIEEHNAECKSKDPKD